MSIADSKQTTTNEDVMSVFCREVRNLLRSKPNCMVPFSKFVPAYHNHYGRQCCVYSFGYTKLIELLEAIPHVVQIIGEGNNRYITLTHREQMKRFASDLIKVVKAQPGKKMKLSQFARAYEQVLGRSFRVEDYGTRNINVLLDEIWEGTINIMPIRRELCDPNLVSKPLYVNCPAEQITKPYITEQYPDAWFGIPKRERSDKEVKRTKYFVWDVIELLSHMEPDYSVQFSKFIPAYHYYFNRQCKVSIFGFSKLIDLFEFISPDVVEIIDDELGDEKIIKLADRYIPSNRCSTTTNVNVDDDDDDNDYGIADDDSDSGANSGADSANDGSRQKHKQPHHPHLLDGSQRNPGVGADLGADADEGDDIIFPDEEEEADDDNFFPDEGDDVLFPDEEGDDIIFPDELNELDGLDNISQQTKRSLRMAAALDTFH